MESMPPLRPTTTCSLSSRSRFSRTNAATRSIRPDMRHSATEALIEFLDRNLDHRWPAGGTRIGHLAREKLIDQRAHLSRREAHARSNGRSPGKALGEVVLARSSQALAVELVLCKDVIQDALLIAGSDVGGYAADHHGPSPEEFDIEAQRPQIGHQLPEEVVVRGRKLDRLGEEQLLGHADSLFDVLKGALIEDPFVSRVLIQDHEARPDLCEDVPLMQLPEKGIVAPHLVVLLRRAARFRRAV